MKFVKITFGILFLFIAKVYSQNSTALSISLAQAFELGVKNRYDIQANKLNVAIAKNTVSKNRKEWLPDISATGNARYNTQLQTMVLDGFGGGNQKITMGTTNLTYVSLDLTQNIFKPGLNTDIKIAKNDAVLEMEKYNEKEISIKQSIAEIYYNVVLKKTQLKLANASLERYSKYYTIAQDKYKLKVILDNDLLKAMLDYENAKNSAQEANLNYQRYLLQLKNSLNIDNTTEIVLTDSIETFQNENVLTNTISLNSKRTDLKQLELQYESNKLKVLKSKQYVLPTISIIGNYTTQFQSDKFDYSKNLWSPYNYLALKVSLPLTGNLKNANTIKEYQLKMQQNEFQLRQKKLDIDNEIAKNDNELINATNRIATSKSNLELSKTLYQNQINMYQLGTVTYANILDAETSMNTAEQNYIKAVYDYLIAKIASQKAMGSL